MCCGVAGQLFFAFLRRRNLKILCRTRKNDAEIQKKAAENQNSQAGRVTKSIKVDYSRGII
ncbi:hypothetical protein D1614_01485 [Maribellus luteus]|uniref:Uncharacterized protein n=1 Tax=Maribellus luteus TaxID=2305463 RepID=A0A399T9M6_9BACT|nr:hypothetical protein D1614_01485 [Maribellus luteus]